MVSCTGSCYILEILRRRGATVAEPADRLEMAPVSVRHHLDILQGDGLICIGRVERTGSVGRRSRSYQLTEDAAEFFPKNFAILPRAWCARSKQVLPADCNDAMFHSMADEMAGEVDMASLEALPLDERLDRVTAFSTSARYLARQGADDGDGAHFLLYKHNCPYAGVSGEHRVSRLMDQMLIDRLVG